jgi:hypothetical protein
MSSCPPTHLQFPPEILAEIVEKWIRDDQSYYGKNTETFYSLCLVSRAVNSLATPLLYDSIHLRSGNAVLNLYHTINSKPHLLRRTRSILFSSSIYSASYAEQIVRAATGLQRICIANCACQQVAQDLIRNCDSLSELSFLVNWFPSIPFPFKGIRRLAISYMEFRCRENVLALLELQNLTHLAMIRLQGESVRLMFNNHSSFWLENLSMLGEYIDDAVSKPRVIFGVYVKTPEDHDLLAHELESLAPQLMRARATFVQYGAAVDGRSEKNWFERRIIDGTLWDMSF